MGKGGKLPFLFLDLTEAKHGQLKECMALTYILDKDSIR